MNSPRLAVRTFGFGVFRELVLSGLGAGQHFIRPFGLLRRNEQLDPGLVNLGKGVENNVLVHHLGLDALFLQQTLRETGLLAGGV
ncbi:MAG TPA: hypothetical protein VMT45_04910 [Thermoanaerobaculaceae bacterium]|nr:hypothetical protein [Thermoanaerobaculaceae bacterium]